jgi:hypothetical protein
LTAVGTPRTRRDGRGVPVGVMEVRGEGGADADLGDAPGDLGGAEIRGMPSASTTSAERLLLETERPLAAQRRLRYRGGLSA